jgi:hypothetical protein
MMAAQNNGRKNQFNHWIEGSEETFARAPDFFPEESQKIQQRRRLAC